MRLPHWCETRVVGYTQTPWGWQAEVEVRPRRWHPGYWLLRLRLVFRPYATAVMEPADAP